MKASFDNPTYDGTKKTPKVTVEMGGNSLTEGTDYSVAYSPDNLTDAGQIAVIVTGTGNYQGTNTLATLEIKPIDLTVTEARAKYTERKYNGTDQVEIIEVELDEDDILPEDKQDPTDVEVDTDGLTGIIEAPDIGFYSEVTFEKVPLQGDRAHNYRVKVPAEGIPLAEEIEIIQGDGPAAPNITYTYDVSKKYDGKFTCTITVTDPVEGAEYRYSMEGQNAVKKNEFDAIEPEDTLVFEVWIAETDNVKEGKHAEIRVDFDKLRQDPPEQFTMEFKAEKDGTFTAVFPKSDNEYVQYGLQSAGGEIEWSSNNTFQGECEPDTEYTGWMKFLGNNTHNESDPVSDTQRTPKLNVERPVISPESGKFLTTQTITITCETKDAEIYYSLDGKDPTTDSNKYTEPFTIDSSVTVRVIAVKEGMENSPVASATYIKVADKDILSKMEIIEGIPEVPSGLAGTDVNTIEAIQTKLTHVLTSMEGYTYQNMAFYDITIQVSADGVNWELATIDNFPRDGITITMPYPPGTGMSTHDFAVSHMFTANSGRLGIVAGETEEPPVTKSAEGLIFTVKGTSPVAIAWKQAAQDNPGTGTDPGEGNNPGTGTGSGEGNNSGAGTGSGEGNNPGAGTDSEEGNNPGAGTDSEEGNNPGVGTDSEEGNNPGVGTDTGNGTDPGDETNNGVGVNGGNGSNSGSANEGSNGTGANGKGADSADKGLASQLPHTGDATSLLLWGFMIAVSLIVAIPVAIVRVRRNKMRFK